MRYAQGLGKSRHAPTPRMTENEEKKTDTTLTERAGTINTAAARA